MQSQREERGERNSTRNSIYSCSRPVSWSAAFYWKSSFTIPKKFKQWYRSFSPL